MSVNKYTLKAAKYEVMGEVLDYLENMIAEHEEQLEKAKKRFAELGEDGYKGYYIDRIDECAVKTEAYKTIQSMFIECFD